MRGQPGFLHCCIATWEKHLGHRLLVLVAWIWRYFPTFVGRMSLRRTNLADRRVAAADNPGPIPIQDPARLRLIRQALDMVRAEEVVWTPWASQGLDFRTAYRLSRYNGIIRLLLVVEPYMPIRVLRQFSLRQVVPPPLIQPTVVKQPVKMGGYKVQFLGSHYPRWHQRDDLLFDIDAYSPCTFPWDYEEGYMDYYQPITHPLIDPSSQPHGIPGDGPRVPRPFVVDMIARQNIVVGELRTLLEDGKTSEVERQHLSRILEILVEDPNPMPPPPRIFKNSQNEAGEGSAVRANQGDEQQEDHVDDVRDQHQVGEDENGAATDNQEDEQHE